MHLHIQIANASIIFSAVKVNALTQIIFNANFINMRLTQQVFSV